MTGIHVYHPPQGNPCRKCGAPAFNHYPNHKPRGDDVDCACGAPWLHHLSNDKWLAGIDGEGMDVDIDPDTGRGRHIYTLMCYSDELGRRQAKIQAPEGLTTRQCLDFILSTPRESRLFAYGFNYDLTMILRDLDNKSLYLLFRPEYRVVGGGRKTLPVEWQDYKLNLIGTKFTVSRGTRSVCIWDTLRFYQSTFVKALKLWKVGEPAVIERMEKMKAMRGQFSPEQNQAMEAYCYDECMYMAALTRKLISAHKVAGLPLKSFYGAGSTASVLLKQMQIHTKVRKGPPEIDVPAACAFFGGRFENRVIGAYRKPIHLRDIYSAYPYQLYQLPCLECGEWRLTKKREDLDGATMGLVKYRLNPDKPNPWWGPFPFRTDDGCIAFPSKSGGGWLWSSEYLAGEAAFSGVQFRQAWVYKTECNHRPFEQIARVYVERLKLGKDGPGIVLKLGPNSCYGKLVQSVGRHRPFRSIVWGGMTTAGCRAQLLTALACHQDWSKMLMVATDGIATAENPELPAPIETGTQTVHNKPLGGWEHKDAKHGMFFARPGIYFPLKATADDMDSFRARGIGRKELYGQWSEIMRAFRNGDDVIHLGNGVRFHGAKSSIHLRRGDDGKPEAIRSERYGQWKPRPIKMSFNPMPKRDSVMKGNGLRLREFSQSLESLPYMRALLSPDAVLLKLAEQIAFEQPQ